MEVHRISSLFCLCVWHVRQNLSVTYWRILLRFLRWLSLLPPVSSGAVAAVAHYCSLSALLCLTEVWLYFQLSQQFFEVPHIELLLSKTSVPFSWLDDEGYGCLSIPALQQEGGGRCRQKPLAQNTHRGPGDGCGEKRSSKFRSAERLWIPPPRSVMAPGCFLSLQQLGITTCQTKIMSFVAGEEGAGQKIPAKTFRKQKPVQ